MTTPSDQDKKPSVEQPSSEKKEQQAKPLNKGMAYVAYLIFFVPLLTDAKDDVFVKYHVKQSLVLTIVSIVGSFIPILNFFIAIFCFVLWIMGLVNVSNGVKKELPLIGQFAKHLDF